MCKYTMEIIIKIIISAPICGHFFDHGSTWERCQTRMDAENMHWRQKTIRRLAEGIKSYIGAAQN